MTAFSVVVPVYNRIDELRRTLRSVANQTLADFECIVVDDGSSQSVQPLVAEVGDRFRYVRREVNGGPAAARLTGLEHAEGDFMVSLDSDNEFFPWTLERAAHYLRYYPRADAAIGLYVFPDGFRTRVSEPARLVGPDEFISRSSPGTLGDAVGIVRRSVAMEWLTRIDGYFATELVFSLELHLHHSVVLVDEPWGKYHTDAATSVSNGLSDQRFVRDIERFVTQYRPRLGVSPCGPVDVTLIGMWTHLLRVHQYRKARIVAEWMRERGITIPIAARRKALWAVNRRLGTSRRVYTL